MAIRAYAWNKSSGGTGNWNLPANWDLASGYPGDGGGTDDVTFPTGMEPCTANAAVDIRNLTINSDHSGADVMMTANMTCTGNVLITQGELQTGDFNFKVTGSTDIYGTLTPGASTCYFGYGNTASSDWDLGVRGTGVLNAGTGDWYTGGVGCYSSADVSLTSGVMYISGTVAGYLWSPDQGVGTWDNRDGTVILQKTGEVRTLSSANPLTAADNAICPFHTLIVSGGTDRTDAPVITLKRGLKIDNDLIIKNGVLEWNTYAGSYGDVYVVASGTHLLGTASQSAAIVMDDMPQRSGFYTATGTTDVGNGGLLMQGNAIVSGSTANIHSNALQISTDYGGSNSSANKTITGLNGTPYFNFPSGEACAVFDGTDDYINMGDVVKLESDYITLSAWVYTNSVVTAEDAIVGKWHNGATGRSYLMELYGQDVLFALSPDGTNTSQVTLITPGAVISVDTWHHIACVADGTDMIVYVDGVDVGSTPYTSAIFDVTSDLKIGDYTGSHYLDGKIADVRIYDEAKDSTAVAALAATNPATSTTGSYPATGTGLVGWWKLQPVSIIDDNGSGDMDFTDASTNSNTGVNNGTVPGWGGLNLYAKDGNYNTLHTYQRNYLSNNTLPLGVEGRGSTVYIRPTVSNMSFYVADGDIKSAVTQYTDGRAFKFNNMNILEKTAGDGTVRFKTETYGCGLFDFTGDLFIASGATAIVYAQSLAVNRAATPVGDIYVSGNLLIYGTFDDNTSTMVDDFDLGYIPRMPQLTVGALTLAESGTYNATPYYTILTGNVGSKNVQGYTWTPFYERTSATFNHNNGTLYNKSAKGYVAFEQNGSRVGPFYNYIQDFVAASTHTFNTDIICEGDATMSGACGFTSGVWGLRNENQYDFFVSGNLILLSGSGIGGEWYQNTANPKMITKGNIIMHTDSKLTTATGSLGPGWEIGDNLINNGGYIY